MISGTVSGIGVGTSAGSTPDATSSVADAGGPPSLAVSGADSNRVWAMVEAENAKGANPPGTVFRDNCLPIMEAGQAVLVDDDYALDDTVTLTPTPGHSPCHCCVNISSKGKRAVVAGDLMHHVIQCREPEWSAKPDWDPKQSAISRRKFFASVAGTDTLILPIHFPAPTVGLITADGDRFDYRFKRD